MEKFYCQSVFCNILRINYVLYGIQVVAQYANSMGQYASRVSKLSFSNFISRYFADQSVQLPDISIFLWHISICMIWSSSPPDTKHKR